MKVSTLLFVLLVLFTQAGNAQTTKPRAGEKAPVPVMRANSTTNLIRNNSSDEEILQRADQIRYQALYQDYSNIANALADSKLEVNDRLTALNRLTETYFGNMPETVTLTANLLKADGSSFSDKEMGEFMTRLTKKSVPNATAKSIDGTAVACITEYYQNIWVGSSMAQVYPGWVIVFSTGSIFTPSCNGSHLYLALPVSAMPANN